MALCLVFRLNHILLVTHCDYRISGRDREELICVPEKSPMQREKKISQNLKEIKELLLECENSRNCDLHEKK